MKRVYDNPSHPAYGPVRRMWVILVQLDLLVLAEKTMPGWDIRLGQMIEEGAPEPSAQRAVLRAALGCD